MELVVDTNIILIHVFGGYQRGRFLERVRPQIIDAAEFRRISVWLDRFLSSNTVVTTSYALGEVKHISERELGSRRRQGMLRYYATYLAKFLEEQIRIDDILEFEQEHSSWWMCFTDTSLLLSAERRNALFLTLDEPLYNFCKSRGTYCRHLVDLYYQGQ